MFPDGTRVAVYDNGRVKVGRNDHRVAVDAKFNFGRGASGPALGSCGWSLSPCRLAASKGPTGRQSVARGTPDSRGCRRV